MSKQMVLLALVVLVAIELPTEIRAQEKVMKRVVRVTNDLGDDLHLRVHCKSKDDDLGVHDLAKGQFTQWTFHENSMGTTLFWCDMEWKNVKVHFDAYTYPRDFLKCFEKCWWSIKQDGAYAFREDKQVWELLYKWKN